MSKNLKANKGFGSDNISPKFLKDSSCVIAPTLTNIFNQSLKTGKFPDEWALARVSPIFKTDLSSQTILESLLGHDCYIFCTGLRWCSGQTTRLSPLRFRVRSLVWFILMWTRTQSSCEKSIVNALPKVMGFLRVLRLPPTGKVDRVGYV